MVNRRAKRPNDEPFRFRVSDSLAVPLRGHMLRLRLLEGGPAVGDLGVGRRLTLKSPTGAARTITIRDHAVTGGRPTQERLDRTGEFDVIISAEDAGRGEELVGIGWVVTGPVDGKGGVR